MISRNTKQKQVITQQINKMKGFFNAEDLYEKIKKVDSSVGLATIYRNLKQLVKDGELYSYICDRRQVFSKTKQHCHFIDEETGKVIHFDIDNVDFLKKKIPGTITSFQIEVKGTLKK